MNIGFNSKSNPDTCLHAESITVNTVGVRRTICENCAHVSVRFVDDLGSEIRRTAFAREADTIQRANSSHNVKVREMAEAGA